MFYIPVNFTGIFCFYSITISNNGKYIKGFIKNILLGDGFMLRSKDFLLMDVLDIKGKKIGYIKDLLVDFNGGRVEGFVISTYKLFQGDLYVMTEDIIFFNKSMIAHNCVKDKRFELKQLRSMDVLNKYGDIIGMVEDILFDWNSFKIKGVLVSTGFIRNFVMGKKIILINRLILGEENLWCYGDCNKLSLVSMPHKLMMEVGCDEKEV